MPEEKHLIKLKVFLCHARDNKVEARELYNTLNEWNSQPWLDAEDLLPGQLWQVEIPKALENSDSIIILLSKSSINKEGYIQTEIKFSLDKALEKPEGYIFLIPARLEDCEVPRILRAYQWVDLFENGGYEKLMKSLNRRAEQLGRATVKKLEPTEPKPELPFSIEKDKADDIINNENLETIRDVIKGLEDTLVRLKGKVEGLETIRVIGINRNMPQEILDELNRLAKASEMPRRIELCQQALAIVSRETQPVLWGELQNALAISLAQTQMGSRAENMEQAIQHFEQALEVRTHQQYPKEWASTINNLATAYRDRIRDERAENIERAIFYYQQALEVRTREVDPENWAFTQNNLAIAYYKRIHGDQAENIEQAIHHVEQALEVRTRLNFPEDWAQTLDNLGNAYLVRIRGEREKNIERAIYHYQQALEVRTIQAFPENWAQSQNNLANAYLVRIRGEWKENIEQAIHHFEQALKVRTYDAFPKDWAETLNNLAGAERIRGRPDDIERAIQHLKAALEVRTRQAFPEDWAETQNDLAIAYSTRKQGKREENIKQAIHHYQQALVVYTPQSFPDNCLKTTRALGDLAFEEQLWELASKVYDLASRAQDILMQTSFSFESRQIVLGKAQNLSLRAAYAHVKSDDAKRAVEVLEKGRAQLLRESFELQQQNLKRLTALGFENLYNDYMQARHEYHSLQNMNISEDAHPADWELALKKVQIATTAIREKAGQDHPEYRYFLQSLSFDKIQDQALEKPIVYLCATSASGFALVVSKQGVQAIEIPELEQQALQKQIWRPSNEEIDRINAHLQQGIITPEDIQSVRGGYFSMYTLWSLTSYLTKTSTELKSQLFIAWQETLDETTHWLWDTVMGRLIPLLKEQGESAVLIPTGQLALLPLHAAWTGDTSKPTKRRYVLDEMNISYVPSAHVLWQASLAAERPAEKLMAVDDPHGTLVFSKDEVEVALSVFNQNKLLRGKDATIKAVKDEIQKADVLHFNTPARAGWQNVEQAQLILTDGSLTLLDIFALDLSQTRLAVLSGSETGVPGLELIDEMIGLPASMMQAGVPGVIGSLWSVSDRSTSLLMAKFYRLWRKDGKTPQEALRQAQIWLRDRLIKFESPYYWAAFTYFGV